MLAVHSMYLLRELLPKEYLILGHKVLIYLAQIIRPLMEVVLIIVWEGFYMSLYLLQRLRDLIEKLACGIMRWSYICHCKPICAV